MVNSRWQSGRLTVMAWLERHR